MKTRYMLLLTALMLTGLPLCYSQLMRFTSQYKVGYKDESGRVVVPAIYDAGSEMKEGFAIIMKGAKRGYLSATGVEAITCQYEDASLFENGLACVLQNGRYGFINSSGEWAIQPIYENAFSFHEGLARICKSNRWGMINTSGAVVIPPIYTRLYDISKSRIAASIDGMHFGYLDAGGKVVIDFRYQMATPFNARKRAIVTVAERKHYINPKGRRLKKVKDDEVVEELEELAGRVNRE